MAMQNKIQLVDALSNPLGTTESPLKAELMGSLPALAEVNPVLIASIPYTDFAASATYYPYFKGVLHRNIRTRTYACYNTMNESTTGGTQFNPYDSAINESPSGVGGGLSWGSGIGTDSVLTLASQLSSDGGAGILAAAVDSFQGGYGMGATAPTSGTFDVYATEVL